MTQKTIKLWDVVKRTQKTHKRNLRRVVTDFLQRYWAEILEGQVIPFPLNLGAVQIIEQKTPYDPEKMKINWIATRKLWNEQPDLRAKNFVYFDNQHTNGLFVRAVFCRRFVRNWHMEWLYKYYPPKYAKKRYSKLFANGKRY